MKAGQKSVGSNGKQNSLFPMDVMYISQGSGPQDGNVSHQTSKAIDYVHRDKNGNKTNRAPVYAPADVTCSHVGTGGDGSAWTTDSEVNTPLGTMRVTYMVWHDNDSPQRYIGEKRKQGELMVRTGTAGNVTGDHLHMEVYKGTTMHDKSQRVQNWELVFVNDTEMIVTYNYPWKTTDDSTGSINGSCPMGDGTITLNEKVNAKVRSYEPMMKAECEKQGIPEHTIGLLALMMVESGGEGGDPMQSSESAGLPPNTIQDPYASIVQGVKHFKESAETAKQYNVDYWAIYQQYNYGIGYAKWLSQRGGVHTLELSMQYSRDVVAPSLGNTNGQTVPYNNPVAIALGVPWRYINGGNFHYASMIQYYTSGDGSINPCGQGTTEGDDKNRKLNDYIKQLLSDQVNGWKW
jgi:hypothetical protein